MKRLHVHLRVTDLNRSISFYNELFKQEPTVLKPDYAKWLLEEPRINFAISNRSAVAGIDHLGIQTDSLDQWLEQNATKGTGAADIGEATTCCYAKSHKRWQTDPDGISWEHFTSIAESDQYGIDTHHLTPVIADETLHSVTDNANRANASKGSRCCGPSAKQTSACC